MRVDVCSDGAQALATWSRSHPDVVVLDVMLPGFDGIEKPCHFLRGFTLDAHGDAKSAKL